MRLLSRKYFPKAKVGSRSNIPETSFAIVSFEEKFREWFGLENAPKVVQIKVKCYDVTLWK